MENIKGITHVTFACRKYQEMKDFYTKVLGMEIAFVLPYIQKYIDSYGAEGFDTSGMRPGDEWITYIRLAPRQFIELYNAPYTEDNNTQDEGFAHFCLEVEDIVEAAKDLEGKGCLLYDGPSWKGKPYKDGYPEHPVPGQDGSFNFFLLDPEGNQVELMQYTENSLQRR